MASITQGTPDSLVALVRAARMALRNIEKLGQGALSGVNIMPGQAAAIDAQLAALVDAVNVAAGGTPTIPGGPTVPAAGASIKNGDTLTVRNAAGVGSYPSAATVVGDAVSEVRLPANVAVVGVGFLPVAFQDGTRVYLEITNGAVTKVLFFGKA